MTPESVIIILPLPAKVLQPNCTVGTIGGREAVEAECIETLPWLNVTIGATFFYPNKRRRDQDNAMGSLKAAYDGIVDAGLVIDDDYEHMNRLSPTFALDLIYPRVMLTITKCS